MNRNLQFISIVNNLVSFNKISHAYIIETDDYEIDKEYINKFIKLILCNEKNKKFESIDCGKCNICNLIDDNNYPDITYIRPDGKEIKKYQLANLQKDYSNKSLINGIRIYVIEEAEKLNVSAANTILKFLEEPYDNVVALLITKNRYNILETILSRCQVLSLESNNSEFIFDHSIDYLIKCIISKNGLFKEYNNLINNIIPDKVTAKGYLEVVNKIMLSYLEQKDIGDYNSNFMNVKSEEILNYISIIENKLADLDYNVNYKLWLDSLFAKIIGGESDD